MHLLVGHHGCQGIGSSSCSRHQPVGWVLGQSFRLGPIGIILGALVEIARQRLGAALTRRAGHGTMDEGVLNAELSQAICRPVVTPFGEAGSIWGGRHQGQRCVGYSWQVHLIKTHAHGGFKMIAARSQGSGGSGLWGWRLPWNHPRSFLFHIFHAQRRRRYKVGAITQGGAVAALVLVEPWMYRMSSRMSGMSSRMSGMPWSQVRSVVELVAGLGLRASCISHGLRDHYCALCSLGKVGCQVGGRNHAHATHIAHIALGSRCHRHLHQRLLMSGWIACHHLTFSMTMAMLTMQILRHIGTNWTNWTWTSWTHHIAMALQTYMTNVLQFWILQEFRQLGMSQGGFAELSMVPRAEQTLHVGQRDRTGPWAQTEKDLLKPSLHLSTVAGIGVTLLYLLCDSTYSTQSEHVHGFRHMFIS